MFSFCLWSSNCNCFWNARWYKKLSGRVWTLIRYVSLYFRDRRGAAQLHSVTEIAQKSPFLYVNRSSIRYGFRSGAKATQYTMNIALHDNCITFGGSLCTTRSTSGISSPLAATSVATKQRTFPSRKLCRVNKIWQTINFVSYESLLSLPLDSSLVLQLLSVELFTSWHDFRRSLGSNLVLPREERRIAVVSPDGVRQDISQFARWDATLYNIVNIPFDMLFQLPLDSTSAVTDFPFFFPFFGLKKRQIHFGQIDLVIGRTDLRAKQPDTIESSPSPFTLLNHRGEGIFQVLLGYVCNTHWAASWPLDKVWLKFANVQWSFIASWAVESEIHSGSRNNC